MKTRILALALATFAPAACTTPAQLRANAIADAKQHCESEGKVFAFKNAEHKGNDVFGSGEEVVSGYCLRPGQHPPADVQPNGPGASDQAKAGTSS